MPTVRLLPYIQVSGISQFCLSVSHATENTPNALNCLAHFFGMNDTILPLFHCQPDHGDGDRETERQGHQRRLDAMGIKYKSLHVGSNGSCYLNLSGMVITDLSPLAELPLTHLCLQGCHAITMFSPLKDMSLTWLNLCRTRIKDLTPPAKLPLSHLDLHRTGTNNLKALQGVPLRSLDIRFTKITDVSPLKEMLLEELSLYPRRIEQGLQSLRGIASLKKINRRPAEGFWERYGR